MAIALANVPLFEGFSPQQLASLTQRAVVRRFPKHAVLVNEGDLSDSLYVLLDGSAKVFTSDEEGREVLLTQLGPGDYFGELAMLDEEPRSASVMTLEACRMMIISRAAFSIFLQEHPEVTLLFLKAMTRRQRELTESLKDLALLSAYQRLIKVLDECAEDKDGFATVTGMSHKDLAERIYTSREMVTMLLGDLKQGGYIESDRKRIVIKKRLSPRW